MSVTLALTDAMQGLAGMPDDSVDLIVTDPPYSGMNEHLALGKGRIVGDYSAKGEDGADWFAEWRDDPDTYRAFLQECHRVLKPNSHLFLMFDPFSLLTLGSVVREVFDVKTLITWDKVNIGMGHYFRRRSEFVLFACTRGSTRKPTSKGIPDVWAIKRLHGSKRNPLYPTQKPKALFRQMIDASLPEGSAGLVLDPFFGSGASACAAVDAGHDFVGFDISPAAMEFANDQLATGGR